MISVLVALFFYIHIPLSHVKNALYVTSMYKQKVQSNMSLYRIAIAPPWDHREIIKNMRYIPLVAQVGVGTDMIEER